MIYLGADHGGFEFKKQLAEYLKGRGYKVSDAGALRMDPDDDYPVMAQKVAEKVSEDPNNRGILLCRSGGGMCITANKIKGIRAAQAWSNEVAGHHRNDDNINVLCLAADFHSFDEIKGMAQKFLDTSFSGEERFKRRLRIIDQMENQ